MVTKVFIPTGKFKGGPAVFRSRLISTFSKRDDIEIVTDINEKFDIGLEFIRKIDKHDSPYILRVSSCYYFRNYKPWNNKPIARSIKKAQHVIFQSKFAYKLCNRVLRLESRGLLKNGYSVIYNGIDLDYIQSIEASDRIELGSFMACARWDPNKRLKSMLAGFTEADTKKHLYVIGGFGIESRKEDFKKYEKKYGSKYIHFLGEQNNEEIISIMKSCAHQIHLAFIDICPNIVIEGLSCGLNVLCTNLGGTPELVGNRGVILKVDKFWDTKYLKRSIADLDTLQPVVVAKGICKLLNKKTNDDPPKFDIKEVSKKYVKLIKKYGERT